MPPWPWLICQPSFHCWLSLYYCWTCLTLLLMSSIRNVWRLTRPRLYSATGSWCCRKAARNRIKVLRNCWHRPTISTWGWWRFELLAVSDGDDVVWRWWESYQIHGMTILLPSAVVIFSSSSEGSWQRHAKQVLLGPLIQANNWGGFSKHQQTDL